MRIGLGCMRLSTEPNGDDDAGLAVLSAALDAGVTLFDTARAYAPSEDELGHNERLIAGAWRARAAAPSARIVTKCGMRREGGRWIPDGRAQRIAEDAAASVEALGGVPIEVLLLHAPDPRVPLATTARALAAARDAGWARSIGVSNVSRKQLEEFAAHVPVAAVEVALGAYDDLAIRSGVIAYCLERGIEVFAYAPLGGPDRAAKLARDRVLGRLAEKHVVGPLDVFLAYMLALHPRILPVVGARRADTIARWAAASSVVLDGHDFAVLDARFLSLGAFRNPRVAAARDVEIALLAGVPGAGKSCAAAAFVARGYERLNRDSIGGTLRGIGQKLDERLRAGATRMVLDNTYVTRATRHDVLRIAFSHGARVRCWFFDTPPEQAQVNVVLRMLRRFGRLLGPEEMDALVRTEPAALAPRSVSRMSRDLERPAADEGFSDIEVVPFVREHAPGCAGVFVALDAVGEDGAKLASSLVGAPPSAPCLVYGWRPEITEEGAARLREAVEAAGRATSRAVELAICAHRAGRPICWCRPPLPGMLLAFAHRQGIDFRASAMIGQSASDRALARTLELQWIESDERTALTSQ
jgi:aryl-alcohol dehydrogenase-like predicted oxidoreductase